MSDELGGKKIKPGARHFVDLPVEYAFFDELYEHTEKLETARIIDFLTDGVVGMWLDFEYGGQRFSVTNKFNDYQFFVEDPECPEEVLLRVIAHYRKLTQR